MGLQNSVQVPPELFAAYCQS